MAAAAPLVSMTSTLCIVGAGPAGLAAAHALRDTDVCVTVVEKSRGLGGRAATRWRDVPNGTGGVDRWRYDHGAQVLTLDSTGGQILRRVLGDALVRVGRVWPFDSSGTVLSNAARDEPRWAVGGGMTALGHALADATPGLELRQSTRATRVRRDGVRWVVETDSEAIAADAVLVTAPAPQASALVSDTPALAAALAAVPYRSQWSVVLGWPNTVARPEPYALVHTGNGEHAIAWLAVESDKPGRAPAGTTLFVAQMSAPWTDAHYDDAKETVAEAALWHVERLVGVRLPTPRFTDAQRWRYSLPDAALDADVRHAAEADGLFVAGDGCVGQGRVHRAVADGADAAARLAAFLSSPASRRR